MFLQKKLIIEQGTIGYQLRTKIIKDFNKSPIQKHLLVGNDKYILHCVVDYSNNGKFIEKNKQHSKLIANSLGIKPGYYDYIWEIKPLKLTIIPSTSTQND